MTPVRRRGTRDPPPPFRIARGLRAGNYPLLEVFPGFAEVPPFADYPGTLRKRRSAVKGTTIQVVDERAWMYVAPYEAPPWAGKYGWKPFTSPADCIVVGKRHLSKSPSMIVYLDILHEFTHILQRRAGRELWNIEQGYVDSPTEIEAYRFSIAEARRLGVSDSFLRNYLKVEWVSARDHQKLLKNVGVDSSRRPSR
jgi:hypothetical protein